MSNEFDFNDADEQFDPFALIPEGTFAKLSLVLVADTEDGLTQSKVSDAKYLKCELNVVGGKYGNKKFFSNFVISGGKTNSNGNSIAGNISRSTLRAILESSRGIKTNDDSKKAIKARQIKSYFDFDGMNFVAEIGIQKAKEGTTYSDQNKIKKVITPGMDEYTIIKSGKEVTSTKTTPKASSVKTKEAAPAWGADTPPANDAPPDDDVPAAQDENIPSWAQ